jgi:hypothetical protein
VFSIGRRCSCQGIMLRQEELPFIKAIYTLQLSPAFLREVKMALSRRKERPTMLQGAVAPLQGEVPPKIIKTARRESNNLASFGDSSGPAKRRPAPSEGPASLSASASAVKCEQTASYSRQLGAHEGGATYPAVLAGRTDSA